jgi:hypothetical protein
MPSKPKTHRQTLGLTRKHSDRAYDQRRMADPALAEAARLRKSPKWQRLTKWFKRKYPLCCDPLGIHGGRPEPTADTHHIKGVAARPELTFLTSNLAPLCSGCHSKIEAREKRGDSTEALFENWRDRYLGGETHREPVL